MRVRFLGTGVAIPHAERSPTSTLITTEHTSVLIDLGSGALHELHRAGEDLLDIHAVFLTHDHIDHMTDILPLLFALRLPFYQREEPLAVYATAETMKRIQAVQEAFSPWLDVTSEDIDFREIVPGQTCCFRDLTVRTASMVHTEASVGYRFELEDEKKIVAIPGDTGWCDSLVSLVEGATLAIVECSVPNEYAMDTHLCPEDLKRLAEMASPLAIAVVHRYPLMEPFDIVGHLANSFEGTTFIPDDGDDVQLMNDGIRRL